MQQTREREIKETRKTTTINTIVKTSSVRRKQMKGKKGDDREDAKHQHHHNLGERDGTSQSWRSLRTMDALQHQSIAEQTDTIQHREKTTQIDTTQFTTTREPNVNMRQERLTREEADSAGRQHNRRTLNMVHQSVRLLHAKSV